MRIEGDLDNMRIVGPTVRPFRASDLVVCPACGLSAEYWWRRFLRRVKGKAIYEVARARYCPGDKPPSERSEGMMSLMFYGSGEMVNKCSGIPFPHLHMTCQRCNAEWFSDVKERA